MQIVAKDIVVNGFDTGCQVEGSLPPLLADHLREEDARLLAHGIGKFKVCGVPTGRKIVVA